MTIRRVASLPFVLTERRFGDVRIWWEAPVGFNPIGLDDERLNGRQAFVTQVDIHYEIGGWVRKTIKAGFRCDGASIPRLFWLIPGFHPLGWHFWATLIHDYACEHPEEIKRSIGDVLFHEILLALQPEKYLAAFVMAAGVKSMTCYLRQRDWIKSKMPTRQINWTPINLALLLIVLIVGLITALALADLANGQQPAVPHSPSANVYSYWVLKEAPHNDIRRALGWQPAYVWEPQLRVVYAPSSPQKISTANRALY